MSRWELLAVAITIVVLGATAAVLATALSDDEQPVSVREMGSERPSPQRVSFLARLIPTAPKPLASGLRVPREVRELASRMPLERKVAQLMLLGFPGQDLTDPVFERLRALGLGGLVIDKPNYASADQLASLAGEARVIAEQEGHVGPWVLAPQEGGEFNAFPDLPPASAAAELESNTAAFAEAEDAAGALGGLGVNGVLAPVVDVAAPDNPAVGGRAYSDDPADVAAYATAVVDAYRNARMLTAAAHFPGLGAGAADTRLGLSQVGSTVGQLRARDLVPFRAAFRAGVPAVLMSNGLYATDDFVTPGSLSRALMVGLLREELGFKGLVITDDLADPSVTALSSIPQAAVSAIRAGADVVYISGPLGEQEAAYAALLKAARRGDVTEARLDEAILRGLAIKRDYGLLD